MTLQLGAVAYDPKVVTIWFGFRDWLRDHGLDFDFVLYSNYERQAEDLVDGRIDLAWNSPLAWLRCQRLATARGRSVSSLLMRDTDQGLTSVFSCARIRPTGASPTCAERGWRWAPSTPRRPR